MYNAEIIERQINELPKGYITRKKINNKVYFYHQWVNDDGKEVYRSVSEEEALRLKELIEKRKSLTKQLKNLNSYTRVEDSNSFYLTDQFILNTLTGTSLRQMAMLAEGFEKRDCYEGIKSFLYSRSSDKVALLYGLRRTGKTTLIRQLILDMDEEAFYKTIYIKVTARDSIADLNKDLLRIRSLGYRYVFIDEITLISDFIDSASLLSDIFAAAGMKIVLSGTDSLGFYFASNEELYDRFIMFHTTFIPFKEHARLLKINNVDLYLRYGGTLKAGEFDFENEEFNTEEASFRDDESTRRYIDTAICKNIQHSLECYKDGNNFRHLRKLYQEGELSNVINRIIEDINHEFAIKVINRSYSSKDLASAAQLLRKEKDPEKRTNILDVIDTTGINNRQMKILDIHNRNQLNNKITESVVNEVREYLEALDLIYEVDIESNGVEDDPLSRVVFTQPGMRFVQAEALVYSLLKDEVFASFSEKEKKNICDKIIEDVSGRMLEDIVLLETARTLPKNRRVFKLLFAAGEYDMVIYDKDKNNCEIYEIKHSDKKVDAQWLNLLNEDKLMQTEKRFGKVTRKIVLYNGGSCTYDKNCFYQNVTEYLINL